MSELTSLIRKDRRPLWEMIPLKQPLRINIDPCDLCNFKCDFCFQSKNQGLHKNSKNGRDKLCTAPIEKMGKQ